MINGFEYPYFLLLLLIIPLLIVFQIFYDKKQYPNIHYSQLSPFESFTKSWKVKLRFCLINASSSASLLITSIVGDNS